MKFIKRIAIVFTTLMSLIILTGCGESVDGKYARLDTDYNGGTIWSEVEIKGSDVNFNAYNEENDNMLSLNGTLNDKKTKIVWDSEEKEEVELFKDRLLIEDERSYYKENTSKYKELQREWEEFTDLD